MGARRAFRDIFEVGGVPAYRQFYDSGIFIWKALYRGSYAPWHLVPAPTIANPNAMRQLYRLNAAKAVSAELAGLVWNEQCDVRVSMNGAAGEDDPLDAFVQHVLRENGFGEKMQQLIEQGLALGGAAIKVWCEEGEGETTSSGLAARGHLPLQGKALENEDLFRLAYGEPPSPEGKAGEGGQIRLGYCMADQFVPTAWDGAQVREGVFISREARDGRYYTRLEWHRRDGEVYCIDNEAYRSDARGGALVEGQDILGVRCPLEAAYPALNAHTEVRTRA